MQMKATWYQYIEISSFCKDNLAHANKVLDLPPKNPV